MSQARPHHPLIVVLIAGFLAACGAPSVTTTMLLPAKQPGMAEAKRIGVSRLKGDGTPAEPIDFYPALSEHCNMIKPAPYKRRHLWKLREIQKICRSLHYAGHTLYHELLRQQQAADKAFEKLDRDTQ